MKFKENQNMLTTCQAQFTFLPGQYHDSAAVESSGPDMRCQVPIP